MVYSDRHIRLARRSGELNIEPFRVGHLNPHSLDLTLSDQICVADPDRTVPLDLASVDQYLVTDRIGKSGYHLQPGQFILGCTAEVVTLSARVMARVDGKSSLGRVGLLIHATAGMIDAGFSGQITLEILNVLHVPIVIYAGMRVAQIEFNQVDGVVDRPYNTTGHYQGQVGPTLSRYRIADAVRPNKETQ